MSTIRATELFSAIGRSVSEAQTALLTQESEHFSQAEVTDVEMGVTLPAGTIDRAAVSPKMRVLKIVLPSEEPAENGESHERIVYVPVASIVPQTSMALSEVRISLAVEATMTEGELYLKPDSRHIRNTDWTTPDAILYGVQNERASDRVELIFRAGDVPEGTAKVVSRLNKVI